MIDTQVSKILVVRAIAALEGLKPIDIACAGVAVGISQGECEHSTSYSALIGPFEKWVSQGDNAKARALLQDLWPSVLLESWRLTTTK